MEYLFYAALYFWSAFWLYLSYWTGYALGSLLI